MDRGVAHHDRTPATPDALEAAIARKRKKSPGKRTSPATRPPEAGVRPPSPARVRSSRRFLILLAVGAAAMLVWTAMGPKPQAEGRVWSEAHGHWHDGTETEPTAAAPPKEGQVWSEEHGHWHDGTETEPAAAAPPKEGQVWSEEHGHWHDGTEEEEIAAGDAPEG